MRIIEESTAKQLLNLRRDYLETHTKPPTDVELSVSEYEQLKKELGYPFSMLGIDKWPTVTEIIEGVKGIEVYGMKIHIAQGLAEAYRAYKEG